MYQRTYSDENEITVPREYDGSLNFDAPPLLKEESEECHAEPTHCVEGIFSRLEGRLNSLLPKGFNIGIEEILIIGAAILIFTSKERDFECIFILISLLFIK